MPPAGAVPRFPRVGGALEGVLRRHANSVQQRLHAGRQRDLGSHLRHQHLPSAYTPFGDPSFPRPAPAHLVLGPSSHVRCVRNFRGEKKQVKVKEALLKSLEEEFMKVGDREVAYVNGVLNPTGFAPRRGTNPPPSHSPTRARAHTHTHTHDTHAFAHCVSLAVQVRAWSSSSSRPPRRSSRPTTRSSWAKCASPTSRTSSHSTASEYFPPFPFLLESNAVRWCGVVRIDHHLHATPLSHRLNSRLVC